MLKALSSISLSLLLAAMPLYAAPADNPPAGEVKALIPGALRNAQPVKAKDGLQWNDLLKTDAQGRLRAGLTAGSILSLGSNSELQVVQHDAVSQQTSLVVNYGKLRNQVVKITQPGGKYEVKTPNAVIGVTGTDFYVSYENNRTTVICYKGTVEVTPTGGGKVIKKDDKSKKMAAFIILNADQMVVIGGDEPPPGDYVATATPPAVALVSMQDTNLPEERAKGATPFWWHTPKLRTVLIGVGTAAGVGLGLGIANMGGTTTKSSTPSGTTIDFGNQFGTVNLTSAGLVSKGSELKSYNGINAPANRSLGTLSFSAGAFSGANILTSGTFSGTGSAFSLTSSGGKYGQPPKGPIFTGNFVGPVNWTLVSQTGKYEDNFTLSGAISGTLYTGAQVTGTTTQNITMYTNQWMVDHETLIRVGNGQLTIPAPHAMGLRGARLSGEPGRRMRPKTFGWSFVW